ncbi:hypothetical protein SB783_22750, partial [Paraburkholderia sp. SIMBA_009]
RLGARIMPGLAGQILDCRGMKIVTGGIRRKSSSSRAQTALLVYHASTTPPHQGRASKFEADV